MNLTNLHFLLEMIGTIAFAFSGAMVAIHKKMDIFGIAILGMTTAVGGGIVRDLILDVAPPAAFREPVYALTSIAVSLLLFFRGVRRLLHTGEPIEEEILLWMDSVGLGVFTVVGVQKALAIYPDKTYFLAVFVGVITGVGGGVMRDLFAGDKPFIFVRHFYASASLIGALLCALLWRTDSFLAMLVGAAAVIVLRIAAAHRRWSLPRPQDDESDT